MFYKYLLYCVIIMINNNLVAYSRPQVRVYYSIDKQFSFKVYPLKYRSHPCYGVFKREKELIWKKELENKCSPRFVLLSNTGNFVITLNEWNRNGFTNNDIVIYDGKNGNVLSKLTIDEIFTEEELKQLPKPTLQRLWLTNWRKNLIDEQNKMLTLWTRVGKKQVSLVTGKLVNEDGKIVELGKTKYEIKMIISTKSYTKEVHKKISSYQHLMCNLRLEDERKNMEVFEFIASKKIFHKFCRDMSTLGLKHEYKILKFEYKDTKQFKIDSFKHLSTIKLLNSLKSPDKRVRKYVLRLLINKQNTNIVIPALIKSLGDWDLHVRKTAKETLITYGKKVKPYLLQNLQNTKINHYIKYNIIEIFAHEEFRDKTIIPLLEKISKNKREDENIRSIAKKVLKKICAK